MTPIHSLVGGGVRGFGGSGFRVWLGDDESSMRVASCCIRLLIMIDSLISTINTVYVYSHCCCLFFTLLRLSRSSLLFVLLLEPFSSTPKSPEP